jgi:hypothetical protein
MRLRPRACGVCVVLVRGAVAPPVARDDPWPGACVRAGATAVPLSVENVRPSGFYRTAARTSARVCPRGVPPETGGPRLVTSWTRGCTLVRRDTLSAWSLTVRIGSVRSAAAGKAPAAARRAKAGVCGRGSPAGQPSYGHPQPCASPRRSATKTTRPTYQPRSPLSAAACCNRARGAYAAGGPRARARAPRTRGRPRPAS